MKLKKKTEQRLPGLHGDTCTACGASVNSPRDITAPDEYGYTRQLSQS